MSDIIKNQHYIPQSSLKHFSLNGKFYEVLVEEEKEPYPTNYRHSMSERFTYEHPQLNQNQLEKFFQEVEDSYAPAIIKALCMIERCENGEETIEEIKKHIQTYLDAIIIYYYRSGALLREFEHEATKKDFRISLLVDKLMNTRYIHQLANTIRNHYEFAIIKSIENRFLISDQYISTAALRIKGRFSDISNRHMGLKDVMMLVPISSRYYAVFYHGRKPEYILPGSLIVLASVEEALINKIIINNSYKKCVGSDKGALTEALSHFEWKSPSSIYIGYHSGKVSGSTLKKEIFYYESDKRAWELFTEPTHFRKYNVLGRNDPCGCNSGKKFKACCYDDYEEVKRIWQNIGDKHLQMRIRAHPLFEVEESIFSF